METNFLKWILLKFFGPSFCSVKNNNKKKLKNICIYINCMYICLSILFFNSQKQTK